VRLAIESIDGRVNASGHLVDLVGIGGFGGGGDRSGG
jgi:hypothetical protein